LRHVLTLALASLFGAGCSGGGDPPNNGNGGGNGGGNGSTVSFAFDILPLFVQDCIHCHGGAGGLSLESHAGVIAGGSSGAVVIAGDPNASLLVRRLDGRRLPVMPLDGPPLTAPEIDRIRQWILEGALNN
jgi:hypothetical protein